MKLLTLVALMLLPFGVHAATAASTHHGPASLSMDHCDDRGGQPVRQTPGKAIDCAMACSLLASAEARLDEPSSSPDLPVTPALAQQRPGLHPVTATPPPKRS